MAYKALLVSVLFLGGLACGQSTLNVPSPAYPTIQTAINLSQNGDTVLVSPGAYGESINFVGKAISLVGAMGSGQTTILGSPNVRVVSFVAGETSASSLSGFTITGGNGGILCTNASPTINDCFITGNHAQNGSGGGISWNASSGGVHLPGVGVAVVTNSILWENSGLPFSSDPGSLVTVTYCNIQGGQFSADPTNIAADPLFVGQASGDYHLSSSSPCVDLGNSGAAGVLLTDLDGTPRIAGAAVDIGADEVPVAQLSGSGDDLDLYSWVNGAGDPFSSPKNATQGDLMSLRFVSPGGTLSGAIPWLLAQLYTGGSPPAGVPGLPVHVDVLSSITLYGGLQLPSTGSLPPQRRMTSQFSEHDCRDLPIDPSG